MRIASTLHEEQCRIRILANEDARPLAALESGWPTVLNRVLIALGWFSLSLLLPKSAFAQAFATGIGIGTSQSVRSPEGTGVESSFDRDEYYRPPAEFDTSARTTIGFAFLTPDWTSNSFKRIVPAMSAADMGLGGELFVGGFEWQPSLNFGVEVEHSNIFGKEMKFSGRKIGMKGDLTQLFTSGGQLTAETSIDNILVGIGPKPFITDDDNQKVSVGFETRYIQISQKYTSNYKIDSKLSSLQATGEYAGIGFGGILDYEYELLPLDEYYTGISLIAGVDANVSVGTNDRSSSLNVNTGVVASSFGSSLTKKSTEFVWGGEVYGGLRVYLDRSKPGEPQSKTKWSVDAVAYGSYWDNVGLLDPLDAAAGDNDLFTYGFFLMGGLHL